jgi:hypothetical protein
MECVGADSAAMKLTYKIIGHQTGDLLDILRRFAPEIGVDHIAYVRMGSTKSLDASLLASYVTYPKEWLRRYFVKQYFLIDPVLKYGMNTELHHFDWGDVGGGNPAIRDFFPMRPATTSVATGFQFSSEIEEIVTPSYRSRAMQQKMSGKYLKTGTWTTFITRLH